MIGRYPTPVDHLRALSRPGRELWVKRDDQTALPYGGNKVRKLERLLVDARERGARRILTFGAAGSHHVLASAIYGRKAGLEVHAILTPQPRTTHAANNLRAGLAVGLCAHPAEGAIALPIVLAKVWRRGDYLVPPGGSSVLGSLGYLDAMRELAAQMRAGELPPPDVVVVALGSGGTAAGLVAGALAEGLATRITGVRIVPAALAGRGRTAWLAAACSRRAGQRAGWLDAMRRLDVDGRWFGPGYGRATPEGERALAIGREHGLELDPTYTAKAFAAALDRIDHGPDARVLFWSTLSSAPFEPLLEGAPTEDEMAPALQRLLVPDGHLLGPRHA